MSVFRVTLFITQRGINLLNRRDTCRTRRSTHYREVNNPRLFDVSSLATVIQTPAPVSNPNTGSFRFRQKSAGSERNNMSQTCGGRRKLSVAIANLQRRLQKNPELGFDQINLTKPQSGKDYRYLRQLHIYAFCRHSTSRTAGGRHRGLRCVRPRAASCSCLAPKL